VLEGNESVLVIGRELVLLLCSSHSRLGFMARSEELKGGCHASFYCGERSCTSR
jgi:hypothetical protein